MPLFARITSAIVIPVVIALFLLEGLARILDPLGISYYPETARFFDWLILEEPIGYRLPPTTSGRFYGVPVVINSLGMRDDEVPVVKSPSEFRIMILGDSVPFGVGVNVNESIPRQLQGLLNSAAVPARTYRVLNMGVPSYNTQQELIQFETNSDNLKPDLLLVLFSANDIEPKMWVYEKRSGVLANLAQRSYALSLVYIGVRLLRQQLGLGLDLIHMSNYRADHPRWLAIENSMNRLSELSKSAGVPLVVMIDGEDGDPHIESLKQLSKKSNLHVERLNRSIDPRWDTEKRSRFVNSVVDSHCNPVGCAIYARALCETIGKIISVACGIASGETVALNRGIGAG